MQLHTETHTHTHTSVYMLLSWISLGKKVFPLLLIVFLNTSHTRSARLKKHPRSHTITSTSFPSFPTQTVLTITAITASTFLPTACEIQRSQSSTSKHSFTSLFVWHISTYACFQPRWMALWEGLACANSRKVGEVKAAGHWVQQPSQ